MTPDGTPSRMATIMPPAAMLKVTGKRAAMPDDTVSLLNSEFPRFPCRAAFNQFQYCTKNPSSRWSCLVIWAISAGVALAPPARVMAGLPGRIRMSEYTPSDMRKSNRIAMSTRRARNVSRDPPLPDAIAV